MAAAYGQLWQVYVEKSEKWGMDTYFGMEKDSYFGIYSKGASQRQLGSAKPGKRDIRAVMRLCGTVCANDKGNEG